jgi:hypothetical protein
MRSLVVDKYIRTFRRNLLLPPSEQSLYCLVICGSRFLYNQNTRRHLTETRNIDRALITSDLLSFCLLLEI